MDRGRANCILVIGLLITLFLTGCGESENRQPGFDGYGYEVSQIPEPEEQQEGMAFIGFMKLSGEYLYFSRRSDGSLFRVSTENIGEMDLTDRELVLPGSQEGALYGFDVDEEQNLYVLRSTGTWSENPGTDSGRGCLLIKYGADGREDYRLELQETAPLYSTCSLVAGDGWGVCLLVEDSICLVDDGGSLVGRISTEDYKRENTSREYLLEGTGNGVSYVLETGNGNGRIEVYRIVPEADAAGGSILEKQEELCGDRKGSLYGTGDDILCNGEDGILYRYLSGEGTYEPVLRWSDCSLGGSPDVILQKSGEELLVHFDAALTLNLGGGMFYLERKPVEELPQREQLVLATAYPSMELQKCVLEFNRSSDAYHITIEKYETAEEQARLDAEIVSSNPPDLLDVWGLDVTKYAGKKVLEDLTPYLAGSDVLERDSYLEEILEAYTFDGRLVCIPSHFIVRTLIGRTSQVGEAAGWTMEEVMELADRYPGEDLVRTPFEWFVRNFCAVYILDQFINWESRQCDFDGEAFRKFVKWAEEHASAQTGWDSDRVIPENTLLADEYITAPDRYAIDELREGEKLTIKGYPTVDGRALHQAQVTDGVAIVTGSGHKEGAWAFLEYFLTRAQEDGSALWHFSSRKDILMESLEEEQIPEYELDEEGTVLYKEDGVPWMKARGGYMVDGSLVEYYYMTENQADAILEMLEYTDFTPIGNKEAVMDIILEELDSYLDGRKALEDVTSVIQNRVGLLLQEGM